MKILVTGSREWKDAPDVREHFRACLLAQSTVPGILVHGGQRGADLVMATVAAALGWEIRPYPVDPAKDGSWPEAGPKRNARMLRDEHVAVEPVDVCMAFPLPGSRGTWDMLRKAERAGVRCVVKDEPRDPQKFGHQCDLEGGNNGEGDCDHFADPQPVAFPLDKSTR